MKQPGKYYVSPKRKEIAEGEKITFEPIHIIKNWLKNCKLLSNRYNSFLVIEIAKTLLRKAEILRDERETPFGGVDSQIMESYNVNTRSGFVRNHGKDFEHKQLRS